ncbi:MAG: leucyl/phenylalanyl-tRNA--protein transferase [Saprospiraceae bacterium]|nr:leucyl/phenylalanyl-tRNA--protein transferase [Saprospiraceae bacterium]
MPLFLLSEDDIDFPPAHLASHEGLLAVGGDLSPQRLIEAYRHGIFPWFNEEDPILWWSPDPRFVLFPHQLKVAKSMRPYFNQRKFEVSYNREFEKVMRSCAGVYRRGQGGTWITEEMVRGYVNLQRLGYAHSVEVWQEGKLVGGLYGLAMGKIFFGESMFAYVSNASKFGFISLVQELLTRDFELIDCQQQTGHLASLGAVAIPRRQFLDILSTLPENPDLLKL